MVSLKKSMALVLSVVMALALCAAPAFAATTTNYTAVNGTYVDFDKYLVLDENANVPYVTFNYSIAPGSAVAYNMGNSIHQVLAGVGTPTVGTAAFTTADTKLTSVASGDAVTLDSGENYAKKTVRIDFSGVSFSEPGVYRYILTETSAGQQGITYDTQAANAGQSGFSSKQRVVDVYVTDSNGSLVVSSYVIHELVNNVPNNATGGSDPALASGSTDVADKSQGFVNEYTTYDVTLSKEVAGNQASRDKVFAFTVTIENAVAGTKYDIDLTGAQSQSATNAATIAANAGQTNVGYLEVPAGETTVSGTFYLSHGQNIIIRGLAAGTTYTIEENAEDYIPSTVWTTDPGTAAVAATEWYYGGTTYTSLADAQAASAADSAAQGDITNNGTAAVAATVVNGTSDTVAETTGIAHDASVAYTNTKSGTVPTGVVLSAIPGIALIAIGGGFMVFNARKHKKEEE